MSPVANLVKPPRTRTYTVEIFRDLDGVEGVRAHRGPLSENRDALNPGLLAAYVVHKARNKPQAIAATMAVINRAGVEVHKVV